MRSCMSRKSWHKMWCAAPISSLVTHSRIRSSVKGEIDIDYIQSGGNFRPISAYQTLKRKLMMSPSWAMYPLPSRRRRPADFTCARKPLFGKGKIIFARIDYDQFRFDGPKRKTPLRSLKTIRTLNLLKALMTRG